MATQSPQLRDRSVKRSPLPRFLSLFVLSLLLTACSSTTFFYNRLDFLVPWYLERYVDLDREQARLLDEQVDGLLNWHRRDELPRYAGLIEELEAALDHELSGEQIAAFSDAMETAWYRLRDRGVEELLVLGAELSDKQVEEFIAEMRKRQRKDEKKYLDREEAEYREDAYDSLRETLEDYLGRLDRSQRQLLRDSAEALRRSDKYWLGEQAQWIDILERELAREAGWQTRIRDLVRSWESQLDAETLAVYEHNSQQVQNTFARVLNDRSEKQDRRLRRKLADFREDFLLLAAQGLPD